MLKKLIENYFQQKRHKGKTRVVRLLLNTLPYQSIRSHYGVILSCNAKDKTNIYAITGDYGYVISNHITSLPKDSIFLDIGANYGLFSNLAAKHLTQGHVYSFEPNPYIYRHYLNALEKNAFKNIIPFHLAIGDKDGLLTLSYDQHHSGLSSLNTNSKNSGARFRFPFLTFQNQKFLKPLKTTTKFI